MITFSKTLFNGRVLQLGIQDKFWLISLSPLKPVTRREQLGPGRASDHTYWPRPPSCPQGHDELKQQWEQLRFRRQESPWQQDSSCRQTPLQFTRSFLSLGKLLAQREQNGHGWHLLLILSLSILEIGGER